MSPTTPLRLALVGFCGSLLVLGATVPGLSDEAKGKKYALLVGVTDYDSAKLPPLKFTENDVVELEKILKSKASGFHDVRMLTNKRGEKNKKDAPTAANVRAALQQLLAKRTRHDTVMIALSGHGVQLEVAHPDDDRIKPNVYGYFCPADSDLSGKVSHSTGKSETLILIKEILDGLADCGAGVKLLLVDACRNEMKAAASTRSLDLRRFVIPDDSAALFSCKGDQKAYETKELKHGVFFHFALKGLRGEAANKRGEVTWDLLVNYVKEHVSDHVQEFVGGGARQDPHAVSNLSGKSPILARTEGGKKQDKDKPAKVDVEEKKPKKQKGIVTVKVQTNGYADEDLENRSTQVPCGIVPKGAKGKVIEESKDKSACLVLLTSPGDVRDAEVWILRDKLEEE